MTTLFKRHLSHSYVCVCARRLAQRLVVLGREDLDTLQAMVVDKFTPVKNLGILDPRVPGRYLYWSPAYVCR